MSSSCIIQLKEQEILAINRLSKDDNATPINGNFTTILKNPITMADGDTLIVRDCFIDTKNTITGKITIEKDLPLKMDFYYYFEDWVVPVAGTTPERLYNYYNNPAPNSASLLAIPSNKKWIPGEIVEGGIVGAFRELLSVTFYLNLNERPNPNMPQNPGKFGGFPLIVYFTNPSGETTHCTVNMPAFKWGTENAGPYTTTVEQYGVGAGFNIIDEGKSKANTANIKGHCVKDITFNTAQMAGHHFTPDVIHKQIILPAGKYSASDIGNEISRRLAVNTDGAHVINSKFLTTRLQLGADKKFLREDGDDIAELGGDHNYFVGTSQVSLNYSESRNSFYFSYLHMPIYEGNEESAHVAQDNANQFHVAKSNSGIIISALHPPEFWNDVLGFGTDVTNYAPTRRTTDVAFRGFNYHALPLFSSAKSGVNFTQALDTIDNVVDKTTDEFYYVKAPPYYTTQEDTDEILAQSAVKVDTLPDAYFMVQLKCKLFSNLVNATDVYKNIQAIVSRYQTLGNYTSVSGGQASIVYTHQGSDVMLSSFEVAILDPTFKNSTNIGSDNTIFIEVVKPPKQLTQKQ